MRPTKALQHFMAERAHVHGTIKIPAASHPVAVAHPGAGRPSADTALVLAFAHPAQEGDDMNDQITAAEKLEHDAELAGAAAAGGLRAVEVASVVLLGLLVCPPLAILTVVVVVPLLVAALALGLIVAVLSAPYLLVHHFRAGHGHHLSLLTHRLRRAARALVDLAPHRIVADVRKLHSGR